MMLHEVSSPSTPWSEEIAADVVREHAKERGSLLVVLHALQDRFGYIEPAAIALVANELNLSRADVYGVVSFYSDFRLIPPGTVRVKVCRGEACQSRGAHELAEHAKRSLGLEFGDTAPDGSLSLDEVFCLGNCALGPSVTVNGNLRGRVGLADFDRLVNGGTSSEGGER